MTSRVSDSPGSGIAAADCLIGRPVSATRIAAPARDLVNHLLGHVLRGVVHCQQEDGAPTTTTITAGFWTYRHPNCQMLLAVLLTSGTVQAGATVTLTAGGGAPQTVVLSELDQQVVIAAPYDAADTGYQEVLIETVNAGIGSITVFELHRTALHPDSGDLCVEQRDALYPLAGLRYGDALTDSDSAGTVALLEAIIDAWGHNRRQAVSWWTADTPPAVSNGAGLTNPFPSSWAWRHRARQKRSGDTSRPYRVYLYTECDAGVTYKVVVSTGADSVEATGLVNNTWAWQTLTGLLVDSTADDTITVELEVTAGVGDARVCRVSAVEDDEPVAVTTMLRLTGDVTTGFYAYESVAINDTVTMTARVRGTALLGYAGNATAVIYAGAAIVDSAVLVEGVWTDLTYNGAVNVADFWVGVEGDAGNFTDDTLIDVDYFRVQIGAVEQLTDAEMDDAGTAAWSAWSCALSKVSE